MTLAFRGAPRGLAGYLAALRAGAGLTERGRHREHPFAAGLGNVQRVDVLPFHQMGRYKWEKLGMSYALGDTKPPAAQLVERTCEVFRSAGLVAY